MSASPSWLSNNKPSLARLLLWSTLLLTACEKNGPEQSWEMAVKGTYSAALSADGRYSLIGSINHGGSLWKTSAGERLYDWNHKQGEYSNIIAAAFSPDSQFALSADRQTMVLWNTETGAAVTYWTAPNEVLSIALSRAGSSALLGLADNSAVIFDVQRGGIQRSFYHDDRVRSVAMSADGKIALSGSEDRTAKLWDVQADKLLFSWPHDEAVVTVALSADGNRAFTVAKYDRAVIWSTRSGKALGELPLTGSAVKRGITFTTAKLSDDGKRLLTGTSDRLVQLWDTDSMTELARWIVPKRDPLKPTSAAIVALSFSRGTNSVYAIASNGFAHRLKR